MTIKTRLAGVQFDAHDHGYETSQCPFCNRRAKTYEDGKRVSCRHFHQILRVMGAFGGLTYHIYGRIDTPAAIARYGR